MAKTIVKKVNGVVTVMENDNSSQKKEYAKNKFFNDSINNDENSFTEEDVEEVKKVMHDVVLKVNKYPMGANNKIHIEELYEKLKHAKSKEDLIKILDALNLKYDEAVKYENDVKPKECRTKKYNTILESSIDLVLTIMIKEIVYEFFKNKLYKLSFSKGAYEHLKELIKEKTPTQIVLLFLDVRFYNDSINNGIKDISEKMFLKVCEDTFKKSRNINNHTNQHLCGNCGNVLNCDKIRTPFSSRKKDISNFSFITDGYQVYDNNEITEFVVTKCNNYVSESHKVKQKRGK